jgi:pyruvate dehydrogenase E2 component (dihydrolipoamide acetyltransferase)
MPKLSPTMKEGRVAKWHKSEGTFVDAGDLLLEIGTDKATIEHHATDPGWLRKILVAEGAVAPVGEALALLTADEKEEVVIPPSSPVAQPPKQTVATPKTVHFSSEKTSVRASPLAKKLAKERGIQLQGIQGTGPGGRIMSRDVPLDASQSVQGEPLSPIRQVIAERLQLSKSTIPHFYLNIDVNAENLSNLRESLKASGQRITINDFVIRATALALIKHPKVRTTFDARHRTVISHKAADICVAVSVQDGLFTPIVFSAESKNLQQISEEVKLLAARARDGKLQPNEYLGGVFTISNLGAYGIKEFYSIINPPQVAILSVGAIVDIPVIVQGAVVPGKSMNLCLAVDHRVLDGVDAATFLQTIKIYLENPNLL